MQETADILISVINFLINDSDFQEFCQFSPWNYVNCAK